MKLFISMFIAALMMPMTVLRAQQQTSLVQTLRRQIETGGEEESGEAQAQQAFELRRLVDPATGKIPANIRRRELAFSAHILACESASALAKGNASVEATNWLPRGPYNIGGRTRALGMDVNDTNIILAAGVSGGGVWRTTDGGATWSPTQADVPMQGATCIAQDTRRGKTNIWYCGTGEILGTAGRPAILLTGYAGGGMYKSTDDGETWTLLTSTVTADNIDVDQPFSFISNIVTDPSDTSKDIVYAAADGGIMRSTDGGTSWTMVLGNYPNGSLFTEVEITTAGVVYAALSTHTAFDTADVPSAISGVFRSTDGVRWTNITPAGWPSSTGGMSIAIAPSNQNVLYVLSTTQINPAGNQDGAAAHGFWKYTYVSGDGTGAGGAWVDRSANLPDQSNGFSNDPFTTQYSYDMYVKVAPDNEDDIYFGGVYLYSSTDGLASIGGITMINNITSSNLLSPGALHPDQHALIFYPGNASKMIAGSDGGIFTADLNSGVTWTPRNNGYYTTQFYGVALDHGTPGNPIIVGGLQDNGTAFTGSTDETYQWQSIESGDGGFCAIADNRTAYYVSVQYGTILAYHLNDQGILLSDTSIIVTPLSGSGFLFTTPFLLDPNDPERMYLAGEFQIYRNNDLTQENTFFSLKVLSDWDSLSNTNVPGDTISTLSVSTSPSDILYYGTMHGKIFRMDNANAGNPVPVNVSQGKGLPAGAYVSCIAIDPQNANNAIAVFANYHVQSLFSTSDGGTTWTPIGGNLEQNPDGSGDGPSCRWASILHVQGGIVYLVGTSTGLYSTSNLNGMSTAWYKEGASTIGNAIVDMMDVRQSDGMVAVATHGSGMFSGIVSSLDAVAEGTDAPNDFLLRQNAPNPFSASTSIQYTLQQPGTVTLRVYDQLGREMQTIVSGVQSAGRHAAAFNAAPGLPDGVYHYRLASGNSVSEKQMMLIK